MHFNVRETALYILGLYVFYIPFAYMHARKEGHTHPSALLNVILGYLVFFFLLGGAGCVLIGVGWIVDEPAQFCGSGCVEGGESHWQAPQSNFLLLGAAMLVVGWYGGKAMEKLFQSLRDNRPSKSIDKPPRPEAPRLTQKTTRTSEVADFNRAADRAIAGCRWSEARDLLEKAMADMPVGWKAAQEGHNTLKCSFWDQEEFLAFSRNRRSEEKRPIFWITPSYSKAWWNLAMVCAEEKRLDNALICIESGIAVEPDHPRLWIEKGFILNRLQRHSEALCCYEQATVVRAWAPASQISRAFRGQGSALIDLGRLDEAETAYRRSLEWEPDNAKATQELEYIRDARQERAERKKKLPLSQDTTILGEKEPYPTDEQIEAVFNAWKKGGKVELGKALDRLHPEG